ncbi:hypothetical protein DFH06DRAFT_1348951 [Mycena polygramma]|nr:hypothetical protein DFH06DRAFT_1348951 [Mycena polygramma]
MSATLADVQQAYAPTYLGFCLATAAYGIGVLQFYLYFRNYHKDNILLKLTIVALWIFDTVSTSSQHESPGLRSPRTIAMEITTYLDQRRQSLVTIITQGIYAWQIWTLTRNRNVTGLILLFALACFGLGSYTTYHL